MKKNFILLLSKQSIFRKVDCLGNLIKPKLNLVKIIRVLIKDKIFIYISDSNK